MPTTHRKVIWVSTSQIARLTGFSARYIREEIREGRLAGTLFGTRGGHGTYRVPADAAEKYVARVTTQADPRCCCGECRMPCSTRKKAFRQTP